MRNYVVVSHLRFQTFTVLPASVSPLHWDPNIPYYFKLAAYLIGATITSNPHRRHHLQPVNSTVTLPSLPQTLPSIHHLGYGPYRTPHAINYPYSFPLESLPRAPAR